MDLLLGDPNIIAADLRPKWTRWNPHQVANIKKDYRKWARRVYKQYMKTGDIRDFNRSQRKLTRWDFD